MSRPWFRVKRFGYGAGLPCSWQGWLVLAGFLAAVLAIASLGASWGVSHPLGYGLALLAPCLVLIWISWRKSDGPWKWRNGAD